MKISALFSTTFAVRASYLESAPLERGLEVVRLGCKNDFVDVEVVGSTSDFAVGKLVRLMNPSKQLAFLEMRRERIHLLGEAALQYINWSSHAGS